MKTFSITQHKLILFHKGYMNDFTYFEPGLGTSLDRTQVDTSNNIDTANENQFQTVRLENNVIIFSLRKEIKLN